MAGRTAIWVSLTNWPAVDNGVRRAFVVGGDDGAVVPVAGHVADLETPAHALHFTTAAGLKYLSEIAALASEQRFWTGRSGGRASPLRGPGPR